MKKLLCLMLLGVSLNANILEIKELKTKCNQKDLNACVSLGNEYYQQACYAKARDIWIKACKGGNSTGCEYLYNLHISGIFNLSSFFKDGFKTQSELTHKTFKFSAKHCNEGSIQHCSILAFFYANGFGGVKQDYAKARKLYAKACDKEVESSCNHLGFLYSEGLGGKQDYAKAKKYFAKFCEFKYLIDNCENYEILKDLGY